MQGCRLVRLGLQSVAVFSFRGCRLRWLTLVFLLLGLGFRVVLWSPNMKEEKATTGNLDLLVRP